MTRSNSQRRGTAFKRSDAFLCRASVVGLPIRMSIEASSASENSAKEWSESRNC